MNTKKGIAEGVDWIIALGLFLLAVGFILVLFKPGIHPVFESQNLLNVVQDGIEKKLSWEVIQQPVFVEPVRFEVCLDSSCSSFDIKTSNDFDGSVISFAGVCHYPNPPSLSGEKITCDTCDATITPGCDQKSKFEIFDINYEASELILDIEKKILMFYSAVSDTSSDTATELGSLTGTTELPIGASCGSASDCLSNYCSSSSSSSSSSTCALAPDSISCTSDDLCQNGFCDSANKCATPPSTRHKKRIGEDKDSKKNFGPHYGRGNDKTHKEERKLKFLLADSLSPEVAVRNPVLKIKDSFDSDYPKRKYLMIYATKELDPDYIPPSYTLDTIELTPGVKTPLRACIITDYECSSTSSPIPDSCPLIKYDSTVLPGSSSILRNHCELQYTLGVPEKIDGLYLTDLLSLGIWEDKEPKCSNPLGTFTEKGYDCFKKSIGFPESRDFHIHIFSPDLDVASGAESIDIAFPQIPPPLEADIRTRQFNTFILNEDGIKVPVVVSLAVW